MYAFLGQQQATAYVGIGAGWHESSHPLLQQTLRALDTVGFGWLRVPRPEPGVTSAAIEEQMRVCNATLVTLWLPPADGTASEAELEAVVDALEHEYAITLALRKESAGPADRLERYDSRGEALRHAALFIPRDGATVSGYPERLRVRYNELRKRALGEHGEPDTFDAGSRELERLICARLFRHLPGRTQSAVLLSSTLLDLKRERDALRTCVGMLGQTLTRDRVSVRAFDQLSVSLSPEEASKKLVDQSTVYLGLLRSWVSQGPEQDKEAQVRRLSKRQSYTELEFQAACARGMQRAFFIGDEDLAVPVEQMQFLDEDGRLRLERFREAIEADPNTLRREFGDVDDLQNKFFEVLGWLNRPSPDQQAFPPPDPTVRQYVAHEYVLLDGNRQMVRRSKLEGLWRWWRDEEARPLLVLKALGGMGKSALAWTWFKSVGMREPAPKSVWWSFYARGSGPRQFAAHLIWWITPPDRRAFARRLLEEDRGRDLFEFLLDEIRNQDTTFLLVLDGIERVLNSYEHYRDRVAEDEGPTLDLTMRELARSLCEPSDSGQARCPDEATALRYLLSFATENAAVDEAQRAGRDESDFAWFLSELARIPRLRILVTSRFVPTSFSEEAERSDDARVRVVELPGLEPDEIRELWTEQWGLKWERRALPRRLGGGKLPDILAGTLMGYALPISALAQLIADDKERSHGSFRAWKEGLPAPLDSMAWFDPRSESEDPAQSSGAASELQAKILLLSVLKLRAHDGDWAVAQEVLRETTGISYSDLRHLVSRERGPFKSDSELRAALERLRRWKIIGARKGMDFFEAHPVMRRALQVSDPEWERRIEEHCAELTAGWRKTSDALPAGEALPLDTLRGWWESLLHLLDLLQVDRACSLYEGWIERSLRFRTKGAGVLELRGAWLDRAVETVRQFKTLRGGGRDYDLMEGLIRCLRVDNHALRSDVLAAHEEIESLRQLVDSGTEDSPRERLLRARWQLNAAYVHSERGERGSALEAFREAYIEAWRLMLAPQSTAGPADIARWSLCGLVHLLAGGGFTQHAQEFLEEARALFDRPDELDADIEGAALAVAIAKNQGVEQATERQERACKSLNYGSLSHRCGRLTEIVQRRLPCGLEPAQLDRQLMDVQAEAEAGGFLALAASAKTARLRHQLVCGSMSRADVVELAGGLRRQLVTVGALTRVAEVDLLLAEAHEDAGLASASAMEVVRFACKGRIPSTSLLERAAHVLGRGPGDLLAEHRDGDAERLAASTAQAIRESVEHERATQPGMSECEGWPPERIEERLKYVLDRIELGSASQSALQWWQRIMEENAGRKQAVLHLAEELWRRSTTIKEFYETAVVYSNTDNVLASLHYFDYAWMKRREGDRKRGLAAVERAKAAGRMPDGEDVKASALSTSPAWIGVTPGLTDSSKMGPDAVLERLEETKPSIGWGEISGGAKTWWSKLEADNSEQPRLLLRVAEEIKLRESTITEFYQAFVYSNSDLIQANLSYLDYSRVRQEEEKKRSQARAEAARMAAQQRELQAKELAERLRMHLEDGAEEPDLTHAERELLRSNPPSHWTIAERAKLEAWTRPTAKFFADSSARVSTAKADEGAEAKALAQRVETEFLKPDALSEYERSLLSRHFPKQWSDARGRGLLPKAGAAEPPAALDDGLTATGSDPTKFSTGAVLDGRYQLLEKLDDRGHVWSARYVSGAPDEVALKVVAGDGRVPPSDLVRKEALALVSARHAHVVRLDDFHTTGEASYLSLALAKLGNARDYARRAGGRLPWVQARRFWIQLASALEFCHKAGILHLGVQPEHVLVATPSESWLAGFSSARLPGSESPVEHPPRHAAPELALEKPTPAADVYALASTVLELASGAPLDPPDVGASGLGRITLHARAQDLELPDHALEVFASCLDWTPSARLSAAEVVSSLVAAAPYLPLPPEPVRSRGSELIFTRCASCRSLVPADSGRCRMCGAELSTPPAEGASPEQPRHEEPGPTPSRPRTALSRNVIEERLRHIACEQLGVDAKKVRSDTDFIEDLGADSLDIVELVMAIEEEYDLEVSDEEAERMATFGDVVAAVAQRLGARDDDDPSADGAYAWSVHSRLYHDRTCPVVERIDPANRRRGADAGGRRPHACVRA